MLKQLISSHNLFIKTGINYDFFKNNLTKSFDFYSQNVDAGCQHSNSIKIDAENSFQKLQSFIENNSMEKEEKWLTENRIDLIIADVASMPLKAGSRLKIPTILLGNFTWHDIYSHLPGANNNSELVQFLAEEYSYATLQILPQCHLQNKTIKNKKEVGFIANSGKNIRNDLEHY
ncbi:MAG: hypothetical protein VX227_00350, partial [Nitrospinota bacterium]|nr:hypothetical protein [Nitrospinota bacterium]